jgi:hypothetical protein
MPDNQRKEGQDKPKIVVDNDWKAQAQAEKEKLAQQVESQKPAAEEAPGEARELPPANFASLVSSLVAQVFFSLGGMEDSQTKRRYVDLELAKHHIDTLAVLEEKTRGNLSPDEKALLDRSLYETRMRYVQIAQRI